MNPFELAELLGDLPDDMIRDAEKAHPRKPRHISILSALAASAALVIAAAVYPKVHVPTPDIRDDSSILTDPRDTAPTSQTTFTTIAPPQSETSSAPVTTTEIVTATAPVTTADLPPFTTGSPPQTHTTGTTASATTTGTITPQSTTTTSRSTVQPPETTSRPEETTVTTVRPEETTVTTFRPEETTGGVEGTTSENAGFWYSYEIDVQREFLGTAPASGDVPFRYTITAEENAAGKQYIIIDTYSTSETLVFSADAENGALAFVIWHTEPLAEGEERHVRFTVRMPDGVQFDPALCSAQAVQTNADPYYYSTKTQYAIPLRIQ